MQQSLPAERPGNTTVIESDCKLKDFSQRKNWMPGKMLQTDAWMITREKARSLTEKVAAEDQQGETRSPMGKEELQGGVSDTITRSQLFSFQSKC